MIELKSVSKNYGDLTVVNNISLEIMENAVTSFIGPNGAGKSTLLGIISRLITKDAGEVIIDGKELQHWHTNELAQTLAILKQNNVINIRLKVRELVSFGRFPYSKGKLTEADEHAIDQAMKYMELESISDKYLDELSGGQCQRAYIAMVIAQDTKYIILDEPLNNLDMKHAVQMMQALRSLAKEMGKTILIVLHDINFASSYSDQIVVLKNGILTYQGGVSEIINSAILEETYELPVRVETVEGKRICIYY